MTDGSNEIFVGMIIGGIICWFIYAIYMNRTTTNRIQNELLTKGKTEIRIKDNYNISLLFQDIGVFAVNIEVVGDKYVITKIPPKKDK